MNILNALQNMNTSLFLPESVITALNSQKYSEKTGVISHNFIQFSYTALRKKLTSQAVKTQAGARGTGIHTERIL